MNRTVRKANEYDAEMISLIGKISFRDAFGNVFDKDNLEEYLKNVYNPDKIEVSINKENNAWFVAELDDRPVGFAKVRKFSLNDEIESVSQVQLEKIYVLPGYQDRGAGSLLLDEVLNLAHELSPDYIWLDVYTGNEKAIRFYERNGFKKETTYYQGFGSRHFGFHLMALPVHADETLFCQ
ncbi:MAG: GNAT family N-acetyltransferase [Bacteroidota bacterium]